MAALRKAQALCLRSSGLIWLKARREASSMQTWTNSQPMPRVLLWPVRSPVNQFAGMLALVAAHRFGRLKGAESVQAEPPQDAADGCPRDANLGGDRLAGQPLAP